MTFKSREEIRPLVSINSIDPLSTQKFTNIGSPLIGPPKNVQHLSGMDQNCLFQTLSFHISGSEKYHDRIHSTVCDFIFSGIMEGEGAKYLEKSHMRSTGDWGMETEILAADKMFHHDICTWYKALYNSQGKWLWYSHSKYPRKDATYLDNGSGCHFNVVLTL